jgi:hypothetical protein
MKKLLFGFMALVLLLVVVACTSNNEVLETEDVFITLDINPGVAIIVDEDDNVILVTPTNQDGEILLVNFDFDGEQLSVVIEKLVDLAIELGFIDSDADLTTISIEVIGKELAIEEMVRERIENNVRDAFGRWELPVAVQNKQYSQEFIDEAQSRGLSAREYALAQVAMRAHPELTWEDAQNAKPEDLIRGIRENHQLLKDVMLELKDAFISAKQEVLDTYLPQIQALELEIEATIENELDTTELEAQLLLLNETMRAELLAVINDFRSQSSSIRDDLLEEFQNRKNQFKDIIPNRP